MHLNSISERSQLRLGTRKSPATRARYTPCGCLASPRRTCRAAASTARGNSPRSGRVHLRRRGTAPAWPASLAAGADGPARSARCRAGGAAEPAGAAARLLEHRRRSQRAGSRAAARRHRSSAAPTCSAASSAMSLAIGAEIARRARQLAGEQTAGLGRQRRALAETRLDLVAEGALERDHGELARSLAGGWFFLSGRPKAFCTMSARRPSGARQRLEAWPRSRPRGRAPLATRDVAQLRPGLRGKASGREARAQAWRRRRSARAGRAFRWRARCDELAAASARPAGATRRATACARREARDRARSRRAWRRPRDGDPRQDERADALRRGRVRAGRAGDVSTSRRSRRSPLEAATSHLESPGEALLSRRTRESPAPIADSAGDAGRVPRASTPRACDFLCTSCRLRCARLNRRS